MNYDTLDYLIPPVRKRCGNDDFTRESNNIGGDVRRPKQSSTKLDHHITQTSQNLKSDVEISSPLGFKPVTNKLLIKGFSITNLIKKNPEKSYKSKKPDQNSPLSRTNVIKITVLPITAQTQTSKINLKRNQKKIHETVSNADSSTQKKNLFLPRYRREIYNIKKTSSVDLLKPRWKRNTEHVDLSLNRMLYTKTILKSLNMNHKGRQEKANRESPDLQISPRSTSKTHKPVKEGCECNNTKINNVLDDMNSRKNRVTIVGRLGINNDDQYILNCAATVNNKPINTYNTQQNFSSGTIDDFENNGGNNKVTKATQADMTICFTTDKVKNTVVNNKTVQCHCKNAKDVATTTSKYDNTESTERKNPLIVITVYPAKDTVESIRDLKDLIHINQLQESQESDKNGCINFRPNEQKIERTADQKIITSYPEKRTLSPPFKHTDKERVEFRISRKRSPSPVIKNVTNNKVEIGPQRSRSRSPPVKTTVRGSSKNRLIQQNSQKSFRSPERQNRQPRFNKILSQKDRPNRTPLIVNTAQTSKVPFKTNGGIKESKKNRIKKAIIESYTERMLMPIKGQDAQLRTDGKPKNNTSSVTINIDGDNERYRVLFLQDKLSTDLSIRKTLKTHRQKEIKDMKTQDKGNRNEDSMGKSCVLAKETMPRKNMENLSNVLNKRASGFKIRDSLEMRHRREEFNNESKPNTRKDYEPTIKITPKIEKETANHEDFSAPAKHYRGDQCCVPNPIVRDLEIRDLLGIKQPRPGKYKFIQEIYNEFIGQKVNDHLRSEKCMSVRSSVPHGRCYNLNEPLYDIKINEQPKFVSTWTQCEDSTLKSCKQMVLNRNVQVFLQVDQFTKQKPIMLSRRQYEKVKKTIQRKVSNRISQERRKLNNSGKCSVVSIGEIRKKRKLLIPNMKISQTVQAEHNFVYKQKDEEEKYDREHKKSLILLHTAKKTTKDDMNVNRIPRQVVSSMEFRYTNCAHLRHITFSASNIKSKHGSLLCLREKNCPSIQTIFKGHKKCVTPNLGTSAFSLYTDEDINCSENRYTSNLHDEKPKKPFLRRLMSCLVMRSNRASVAILPRQYEPPNLINSFDSYYINTSLAAIELSSSLYDTSASFYSNHTVMPIARMKRGFFSSVRGFLTNLKSR